MHTYVLERSQVIHRSRGEVFAFFGDAFNLERITPPLLHFRVLSYAPVKMRAGALLDYRLALFGVPFYWRTLIESWTPEESFVDTQIKGPYRLWRHTHTFEALSPETTLMRDRVEYGIPLGILGRIAHRSFVAGTLKKIFDYRSEMTARLLAPRAAGLFDGAFMEEGLRGRRGVS
ncbi:MAG TPA: SRPBCC family protein [Blastocatellia bacterium]|jgi:ligand-binding SRPBCC domain-containing protein|nr:SRPBCC family protein [Blastocatellia bacterium]